MRSSTEKSGSGEKANLAAGTEAVVEVVLVHPVLEVTDPDGLILLAPVPAGSGRRRGRRAAPVSGGRWGRRPGGEALGELRRLRWRDHHGRRRRIWDDDPPGLRHVAVRMRVGVRLVRRHGRLGVGGCRRHLHHRRRSRRGGSRCWLGELARGGRRRREGARRWGEAAYILGQKQIYAVRSSSSLRCRRSDRGDRWPTCRAMGGMWFPVARWVRLLPVCLSSLFPSNLLLGLKLAALVESYSTLLTRMIIIHSNNLPKTE
jgi:hypothetical protein